MTIDSTFTFGLTETQIIQRSMELIGASGIGETITADDYNHCQDILNSMLKSWDAIGLHQWKQIDASLIFNNTTTNKYLLGVNASSPANASEIVNVTTVGTAVSSGVNTVIVASVAGISVSDNLFLFQDDGSMLTTTVTGINSGTKTLTLNNNTTTTAAVGNPIYSFTSFMQKPMQISDVRRIDASGNEIVLKSVGSTEYFALPNKTTAGDPVLYYFEPHRLDGALYLWPQPNNLQTRIVFRYSKQIADLLTTTDNPDLPQEYYLAIIYNLALRIAPAFGRMQEAQTITPMAISFLEDIKGWDNEQTSIMFRPAPKYS